MKKLRSLLLPFSWIFGLISEIRNFFFDSQIFKSSQFDIPTICVGNLSVGGTGKSPHIEYLIRLLKEKFTLATLSRGYGRKSTGFLLATTETGANQIGDEPKQFACKFPDISVAVDGNRVRGMMELVLSNSDLELVLLDDAYQHRAIKAGLYILLSDFNYLFYKDQLLPAGNLREKRKRVNRADAIVVSKCPEDISEQTKQEIIRRIESYHEAPIFFSKITYSAIKPVWPEKHDTISKDKLASYDWLVITGIANPSTLFDELNRAGAKYNQITFPDHHRFSPKDLQTIRKTFYNFGSAEKRILTTEKDAVRMWDSSELIDLPIFYYEIEIRIDRQNEFEKLIFDYVEHHSEND